MTAHARSAAPHECCGLLIGTPVALVEAVRSANLADDPTRRFLIDPRTHIAALRRARTQGLAVVGFYHSHPRSTVFPSAADVEGASYPDHVYVIVAPGRSGWDVGVFRLARGALIPEAWTLEG